MIRAVDQYIWNLVFLTLFLLLVLVGVQYLKEQTYIGYGSIGIFDFVLLSLATFRLVRLFVYDRIMKFFREMFWNAEMMHGEMVLTKPIRGPRRTIADLLGCPWCTGIWMAAVVTFFYFLTPLAYVPIVLLSVAAVGSFLQLLANMVGWKAEGLKHDVEHT